MYPASRSTFSSDSSSRDDQVATNQEKIGKAVHVQKPRTDDTRFRFFDLPAELRTMVLSHCDLVVDTPGHNGVTISLKFCPYNGIATNNAGVCRSLFASAFGARMCRIWTSNFAVQRPSSDCTRLATARHTRVYRPQRIRNTYSPQATSF
jgi:hypothetical protein